MGILVLAVASVDILPLQPLCFEAVAQRSLCIVAHAERFPYEAPSVAFFESYHNLFATYTCQPDHGGGHIGIEEKYRCCLWCANGDASQRLRLQYPSNDRYPFQMALPLRRYDMKMREFFASRNPNLGMSSLLIL